MWCVSPGPPYNHTICVDFTDGTLLWSSADQSPHPFFLDEALYLMPRVAGPAAGCRKLDPQTGRLLDEFRLGVIGSCTRLTVTPSQFYYRPGGGEGRTVYFDLGAGELAAYEGIVRPGCFDGVVPANGRLYWMPLACDCWQVHGTFSMAPREPLPEAVAEPNRTAWETPEESAPAGPDDWPMFRADAAGTATVAAAVPRQVRKLWSRKVTDRRLTAPVCVAGRVFVGSDDGSVQALDASDGATRWTAFSSAAVLYPPAYWNGRAVFGSCDGTLVSLDASNGKRLGSRILAPEPRFVNIMGRLMSAWPLGGGVLVDDQGTAYVAAGSTAADGTVAVAVDLATGRERWRRAYTLDGEDNALSFGVQSNLLARSGTLYINGGAPVGIVALDANTGGNPRAVARLEAGMEMFLEPDGTPSCSGPELYCQQSARTTIFKRHQNRVYFRLADRHVALIDGRVFCARDREPLDAIVRLMNTDPQTGGRMGGGTVPWDVRQVPLDDSILWASEAADVRGVAVGTDGLVVIRERCVEARSAEGDSLWTVPLSAPPVRWGLALAADHCVVTLTDGTVCCLGR
jgi:outer membrane protein assembly factor BamB